MSNRKNFSSLSPWEDTIGYSRAVQIGNCLEISGTVAAGENGVVGDGDIGAQTTFIIQKIEKVLHQAGYSLKDVIRTRMFVTDISQWEKVGRAHGEFFKDIKPVTSMIGISKLIGDEYLIEIEMTAMK
jgi:enamine deaminase RidA (YjgF/YER057c/UK114 family)